MKTLEIRIPEEIFLVEAKRPPGSLRSEDFDWCLGALFVFNDGDMIIDAPLFGFLNKLLRAAEKAAKTGETILMNDENGGYQIELSCEKGGIRMCDAYGGHEVLVEVDRFIESGISQLKKAVKDLEERLPDIKTNGDYIAIKTGTENAMRLFKINLGRTSSPDDNMRGSPQ